MPSFFRTPSEDASSSDDSSDNAPKDIQDFQHSYSEQLDDLSRIQTLSTSGAEDGEDVPRRPRAGPVRRSSNRGKDLIIHALLEEKARKEAADELLKAPDHPDVVALSQQKYNTLSQSLHNLANVSSEFSAESHRTKRETVRQGLQLLSRSQPGSSALPNTYTPNSGSTTALASTFRNVLTFSGSSGSNSPRERTVLLGQVPESLQPLLGGHTGFNSSRYAQEFEQKCLLGKGGYGHVYMAKNRLDGFDYAVKRIPLSTMRMRKIYQGGQKELELLLEEVRTLARLDHRNIVRYHHAWLEASESDALSSQFDNGLKLLEGPSTFGSSELYSEDVTSSASYVENEAPTSLPTASGVESSDHLSDDIFDRSGTPQGSRKSQSKDVDEEDADETILRESYASHELPAPELTPDLSQLISNTIGLAFTLNIQMSLHPLTLEQFLAAEHSNEASSIQLKHCFHPAISLRILLKILKGVSYLHSQNVVHRDLKPANILLSVSPNKRISGSIDITSCHQCSRGVEPPHCVYINPRIGDFGLVGALEDALYTGPASKAVGTEFYRPTQTGPMSEKIDVFALGVILFELLREFPTRMERIMTLQGLKLGRMPTDFAERVGERGERVAGLINAMVDAEEAKRLTCLEVKHWIEEILAQEA
ncbi:kinase-like protein [Mytilinidion resinicola]|uniref:Kinase-like protein n=1 Tax=Mytilinidion resinicola TaxID=574789 RepID=A0A6A6Y8G7_9PEZI|nr:kinase-like protein [Mytilinidion resinicola]KAF2804848.1 kinase-like protein [Mytilinidion resinicola]